jgi:hypothetical protein
MRLRFQFLKIAKIGQTGECTVDVDDPTDSEAIAEKLRGQEFSRFLVKGEGFTDEEWSFQPLFDDPNERLVTDEDPSNAS